MELGTFAPRPKDDVMGDQLAARDAVDKPLVVFVREHRTGITTQYKPNGDGIGVIVDVADTSTNEVWIDVLWMNGPVVDNLAPYVGQAVPIKLVWTPSKKAGGNAYIGLTALTGAELATAQQWAAANASRFDTERAQRQAASEAASPVALAPITAAAAPAPAAPPAAPKQALDPSDPAVAALLAQLNAQTAAS